MYPPPMFRRRVPALRILDITPPTPAADSAALLETGDQLLLESGDVLILES
jgi:hypothetical protein